MRKLIIASAMLFMFIAGQRLFARSSASVLMPAAYPGWDDAPKTVPTLLPVMEVRPEAPVLVAMAPTSTPVPPPPAATVEAFTRIGLEASWEKPNVLLIVLADKNSRFQTGKDILTEVGLNEIKALAQVLKSTSYRELEVDGHADRRGSFKLNQELSTQRARRVYTTAVDFGAPNEKFKSVKGWSYTKPLVKGSGSEVWGRNRRVEVRVITEP